MNSIFLDTIQGKETSRPPMWFMRQAGRVLPNYLKLKEQYSFWQMMQNPKLAAQVTLLPVSDLGVDAAILFSDILVIPYALGMGLDFTDNGPVFEHPIKEMDKPSSKLNPKPEKLQYIYNVIDEIIRTRPENTPLIGFAGAPLTVLSFMIQGLGSRSDFKNAVQYIFTHKNEVKKLIDAVTELTIIYAKEQIKHGIEVFQLFETNAGLIPIELYNELFMPSVYKIAKAVKEENIPFIFFPKGFGTGIMDISPEYIDFVSVDWQTPIRTARKLIHKDIGIQGNIDPRILFADKKSIETELKKYQQFGQEQRNNWILNFGHGFLPGTPFENAKFMTDWIKNKMVRK